ncbi:hypothetical protein CKO44_06260 [Rubrivivax gelatinosus]|uniref:hypothetical protein n=1 Tax=Rubrivivax gelatinosus TaxID=28068 RepID=UPI00190379D2|nr:hypothetical protein [Rubrivivax gelatinosus]MBK1613076.1 hypothetical protein [Rubrivivax gelatinosus]MBZ8141311.1 hypothetical protein [Rubrivivax gelatinosus]
MYHQSLYAIVMDAGTELGVLTREMQGEPELFASTLTLAAVEARLLTMAHTLGNLTPVLRAKLPHVDWAGWQALHELLRLDRQPRRDAVWYAVSALAPQTMELLAALRRREPVWFERGY